MFHLVQLTFAERVLATLDILYLIFWYTASDFGVGHLSSAVFTLMLTFSSRGLCISSTRCVTRRCGAALIKSNNSCFLQASAVLMTRFILNLRSFDLPKSHVPGESISRLDQSSQSSHLIFMGRVMSIDFLGSMGFPLDHGEIEEREDDPEVDNVSREETVRARERAVETTE